MIALAMILKKDFQSWVDFQYEEMRLLYSIGDAAEDARTEKAVKAYMLRRLSKVKKFDENSDFALDVIEGGQQAYVNAA